MSQICLSEILIELASCILFVRSGNPIYLLYEQGEYVVVCAYMVCVCVFYACSRYLGGRLGGSIRRKRRYRKPEGVFKKFSLNQPYTIQTCFCTCNTLLHFINLCVQIPTRQSRGLSLVYL